MDGAVENSFAVPVAGEVKRRQGNPRGNPNLVFEDKTPNQGVNNHLPDALFNDTDTTTPRKREKLIHRVMANMHVAGFNHKEIAAATGYGEAAVSDILKTPAIREYMLAETRSTADDFRTEIILSGKAAFARANAIAESAKSEAVRLDANKYIINRWLGMPTQPVEQVGKAAEKKTDAELLESVGSLLDGQRGVPIPEAIPEADKIP